MNQTTNPVVTITSPPNVRISKIKGDGVEVQFLEGPSHTTFAGTAENRILPTVVSVLSGTREKLLLDAVNNRTRERNYYQLYSQLLENTITDEEFDKELDNNPDDYVVPTNKIPSETELYEAFRLADIIKGIRSMGDLESLFSFNPIAVTKYCKLISNESL